MPSVLIKTNVPLDDEAKVNMMKEASKAVAENTGKPESFVLVSVDQCAMIFGGSADPCAYIFLASLGSIGGSVNADLTKAFSAILKKFASVSPDRMYVQFNNVKDRNDFGWNGSTFG